MQMFVAVLVALYFQSVSGTACMLEKHAVKYNKVSVKEVDCKSLLEGSNYETTTLHQLYYNYGCLPKGWEEFFCRHERLVKKISYQLNLDRKKYQINPKVGWVFRAFQMVPPEKVKVIVLGQDPAPQPGLATGLSFSLHPSVPPYKVPSVQRVILEAMNEGYCVNTSNGELISWAQQGVLLLNTALTLKAKKIASHLYLWKQFSKAALKFINERVPPSVWILWGNKAKYFQKYVDKSKHYVVKGGHPSPRANPFKFFCQNYFYCANQFLCSAGRSEVDWNLKPLPCYKNASMIYGSLRKYPGFYRKTPCMMQPCP